MFKPELKIFRPWASASAEEQDCTITTTTSPPEDASSTPSESSNKLQTSPKQPVVPASLNNEHVKKSYSIKSFDKIIKKQTRGVMSSEGVSRVPLGHFDPYALHFDALHSNLAQSLGVSGNDSFFLDSMAQGYAIEEYARILSQEQQSKLLLGRKQRPKKYKCPHCDVGFSNNGQLKGHIRIHTGERPFRCDEKECGKTFTRNEELTRHKRIHSGLRPYPCAQCGKRFGRKDHLKKHTRTHIQQRAAMYAVPVMIPLDTWGTPPSGYPYMPAVYGY